MTEEYELTELQDNALRLAYHNGWFNTPKEITIRAMANILKEYPVTVAGALKIAQRKLILQYIAMREAKK